MSLIKMMTFCKSPKCTSSETLLSFQKGEISGKAAQKIEKHLESCEFCTAEVEFYNKYPQSDEVMATVEMPVPLFELAKALLSNRNEGSQMLDKLASESETLHLKEV
jgi:hypothetical protein